MSYAEARLRERIPAAWGACPWSDGDPDAERAVQQQSHDGRSTHIAIELLSAVGGDAPLCRFIVRPVSERTKVRACEHAAKSDPNAEDEGDGREEGSDNAHWFCLTT